ncbi:MAG TPA: M20/M25/M40 family metallo-hydrolase [Terriglobales bacterium]|nr:M20/M25/M40 family metallo-hydrolase [Terriglobales bacterium]
MRRNLRLYPLLILLSLLATLHSEAVAQTRAAAVRGTAPRAAEVERRLRADLEFLASDALRGRGSATHDEQVSATYIAAQLRAAGLEPAGDAGGYLQRVELQQPVLGSAPTLTTTEGAESPRWTHGREMLVLAMQRPVTAGPLQKIDASGGAAPHPRRGAVVFLTPRMEAGAPSPTLQAFELVGQGAAAVLLPEWPRVRERWEAIGERVPEISQQVAGLEQVSAPSGWTAVVLNHEASRQLSAMPDGTLLRLQADVQEEKKSVTWNVLGRLPGRDPALREQVVLLSAHHDHVGVGKEVNGDGIYNGADDDASGVAAVLELARQLAAGPRPRRTVLFALFGSEESGGLGSLYFRERPPVPLEKVIANLGFEMLGRPDGKVPEKTLWLTGYERSSLGPRLAVQGARLVADPHPDQDFFRRSDNYVLARRGVVAHTISSYGLHKDYHQPSDEVTRIDFAHMTEAVQSLVAPVRWLANSSFTPKWNPGKQP